MRCTGAFQKIGKEVEFGCLIRQKNLGDTTMSWFKEDRKTSYVRQFCNSVLRAGPMPKHVAIIMDGNRRFAEKVHCARLKGHEKGFDKLTEVLEWCFDLGIPEVTVYAFSIENFKRSEEEVDGLMELAKQKFDKLMDEKDMIEKHGICVRALGDLSLLPEDVQRSIARVMKFSRKNKKSVLNVCMAYTSRHEISAAVKTLAEGVELGLIKPSDINESLLEQCLYTSQSCPPDLMIRTSGEVRFSDFLLWQTSNSCLAFLKVLWPEMSIWDFYGAVLSYQWSYKALEDAKKSSDKERERTELQYDVECVLEELTASNGSVANGSASYHDRSLEELLKKLPIRQRLEAYREEKQSRRDYLISHIHNKRTEYIDRLCPSVA